MGRWQQGPILGTWPTIVRWWTSIHSGETAIDRRVEAAKGNLRTCFASLLIQPTNFSIPSKIERAECCLVVSTAKKARTQTYLLLKRQLNDWMAFFENWLL